MALLVKPEQNPSVKDQAKQTQDFDAKYLIIVVTRVWPLFCNMVQDDFGSSLKKVKFSRIFGCCMMLYDAVLICHAHLFDLLFQTTIQHAATYCNRVAKCVLYCVEMLRAFAQLLRNISQHDPTTKVVICCVVASVWPGLKGSWNKMLRFGPFTRQRPSVS